MSEDHFRAIFDAVNDAISIHDVATGEVLDVNARMPALLGYSADEIRCLGIAGLSATSDDLMTRFAKAAAGEEQVFEWRVRHKDGRALWMEASLRAATIGGARRMIVVTRDITQRKEMEDALRAEKELTDTAIRAVSGVFLVQTREGRFVRWNEAFARIATPGAAPLKERVGRPLVHPDDRLMVEAKVAEVFEKGGAEIATRMVLGDPPETRHYVFTARRMETRGEQFLVATGIDVTERVAIEAEQQRLQSEIARAANEWQQTFDAVGTPIIITDRNGTIVSVNRAAGELSGVANDRTNERSLRDLGDAEPWQTASQLVRYIAGEKSGTGAETKDAGGRTWDITVATFAAGEEGAERFILVFWDVTRIIELQESLRRSETMSAMGTLVAGVAHEVRNPLFGISATLDAYQEELSRPDYAECATTLRREVTRLTRLMQELLDYGRPSRLQIESARLYDVVRESIERRRSDARNAGVAIHNFFKEGLTLLMDRSRMGQVFDNLIDNAWQHAPRGGHVQISGALTHYAGRPWVEAHVEDNGRGFDPTDLHRVFEPFYSLRPGGTGLGLSLVQRIVEEHGGKVTASNRSDGGARITIRLPLPDEKPGRTKDAADA